MARDLFDELARLLVGVRPRRGLLRLLGAAFLTSAVEPSAAAAPKRRPACRKVGKPCSNVRRCCAGARCVRARCRCRPGRKPCGGACIPRRARCLPPGGGPRRPPACPPNTICCPAGHKLCFGNCIPATACCTGADCAGECRSGLCLNGACEPAPRGTPCANNQRRCDSRGVCAQFCTDPSECPQPPDTDVGFCRMAECNDSACEEVAKPDLNTHLPEQFQTVGDCKIRVCNSTGVDGIGIHPTEGGDDVLPHPNPCIEAYCQEFERWERPWPVGHPCSNGGTCNGQGACVGGG